MRDVSAPPVHAPPTVGAAPRRRERPLGWRAPRGLAGLGVVAAHVPRLLMRRPLAVLLVAASVATLLDLMLRALTHLDRSLPGDGAALPVIGMIVVWPCVLLVGARHVAGLVLTPRGGGPVTRTKRHARWPIDFGFGLGLLASLLLNALLMYLLFELLLRGQPPSRRHGTASSIAGLMILTAAPAPVGAAWMATVARHLVPEPRPTGFPLQLARTLLAWLLSAGCVVGFFTRFVRTQPFGSLGSWWRILVAEALPIAVIGLVVAALADVAAPRRADPDIGRVFE